MPAPTRCRAIICRDIVPETPCGHKFSLERCETSYEGRRIWYDFPTMREFDVKNESFGWTEEDFVESPSPHLEESDPWADSPGFIEPGKSQLKLEEPAPAAQDIDVEILKIEDDDWNSEELEEVNPWDDGSLQELAIVQEFDEPEPLREFDPDSREPLYVAYSTITSLSIDLKIDELVARVSDASDAERQGITELLSEITVGRLRTWLTWMRDKAWTGASLLSFLEFRVNHWEASPQWWEGAFWSPRLDRWWWTQSTPNTLSLEATYMLFQARSDLPPDEVIDDTWLNDWEDFGVWRSGFSSFAAFAVFRAALRDDEDWRDQLAWTSEAYFMNETDSAVRSGLYTSVSSWNDRPPRHAHGPAPWYARQDWYEPAEWHDNLGWVHTWMEATHPYLSDESFDSMSRC